MQTTAINPVQFSKRIPIVDILRGWALFGVVLMNYAGFYEIGANHALKADGFNQAIITFGKIVFASKSWTMLSFLFGYGFAVLMENTASKGVNAVAFFSKRMFWLLMIAFINCAIFFGDILKEYATLGMLLLLFRNCRAKTAFWIGIGIFIVVPAINPIIISIAGHTGIKIFARYAYLYKSHSLLNVLWFGLIASLKIMVLNLHIAVIINLMMLGCFLLGLAAHKAAFFSNLAANKKTIIKTWIACLIILVITLILNLIFTMPAAVKKYYNPDNWVVLITMAFTVLSICWLYLAGKLKSFFNALQLIGKMTLTNYLVQNFISIFLFSGFGFGFAFNHRLAAGYYYLFAIVIYVAQVYFSKWWLTKFYYGPVEWIWRQLSYGKRLAIKIKANVQL